MKIVLGWIKTNIIIVILVILIVVPLPVAWFFSSSMNTTLREERQEEAQRALRDINGAKVTYALPTLTEGEAPIEDNAAPNTIKTQFFQAEREKREAVISRVKERAVEFNSKDRGVLIEGLFPEPASRAQGQLLQPRFGRMMVATGGDDYVSEYDKLFRELRIHEPVDTEVLAEQLSARRNTLVNQLAPGVSDSEIDEATREQIRQQLVEQRLGTYETHARDTSYYGNPEMLPPSVPRSAPVTEPSLAQCFAWQFDYWIIHDVLSSLVEANDRFDTQGVGGNVIDGVVKRVDSIRFNSPVTPGAGPSSQEDEFAAGPPTGGDAAARLRAQQEYFEQSRARQGQPTGMSFTAGGTITGRDSEESSLYDVVPVEITLIASYDKLPVLFDAISSYNFMTVLDADIHAVNPWELIESGFYAGNDYVVRVELTIETLWLRSWTKEYMPPSVREQLGIQPDAESFEDPS